MIVDRLPGHAGFRGDFVDAGAGKTLATEDLCGGVEDRDAFGALTLLGGATGGRQGGLSFFHHPTIGHIDRLDNSV
ncbi:hypothetical protein D3C80_1785650 [compost metagenome]